MGVEVDLVRREGEKKKKIISGPIKKPHPFRAGFFFFVVVVNLRLHCGADSIKRCMIHYGN